MTKLQGVRSSKDSPKLVPESTLEDLIKAHNELISELNFFRKNISLQSNFNCHVVEVSFAAGQTKAIPHSLGILPKFRIILRQEGNGVLSDIPSGWNTHKITIKNEGTVAVKATIVVLRE